MQRTEILAFSDLCFIDSQKHKQELEKGVFGKSELMQTARKFETDVTTLPVSSVIQWFLVIFYVASMQKTQNPRIQTRLK